MTEIGSRQLRTVWGFPLFESLLEDIYGSLQLQSSRMLLFHGDKLNYEDVHQIPVVVQILEKFLLKVACTKGVTKLDIEFKDGMVSICHNGICIPVEKDEAPVHRLLLVFGGNSRTWSKNNLLLGHPSLEGWEEYLRSFKSKMEPLKEPTIEEVIFMVFEMKKILIKDATLKKEYEVQWGKEDIKLFEGKENMSIMEFKLQHVHRPEEIVKTKAIEINATVGNQVAVTFNGLPLNLKRFREYVNIYPMNVLEKRPEALGRECIKISDNAEVCITRSDGVFMQESYVNGHRTHAGGNHIDLLIEKVQTCASEIGVNFKEDVKDNMMIFINLTLHNPKFTLSKDKLTSTLNENLFSNLDDAHLKKCIKNITNISYKEINGTLETDKYQKADKSGGEESNKCTLILTEGDSAIEFVKSGISHLRRDYYGILSLKGKLPNALTSDNTIFEHEPVKNIVNALGLDCGVHYNNTKFLRYGHLMLMMDQDEDGSHIKGLVINLFATHWPSLIKINGFLSHFITPVIKVTTDKGTLDFYSLLEFNLCYGKEIDNGTPLDDVIYFKGLGTHGAENAKKYFMNKASHNIIFDWHGTADSNAIELAFSAERSHDRKIWINETMRIIKFRPERLSLNLDKYCHTTYSDFFHKEFVRFSVRDVLRSIPSLLDGLKPSQRKVLFAALEGGLMDSQNMVYQFAGYISKRTAYHHGGVNIEATIIGMAQNFVGTNNISLLEPIGQFGSEGIAKRADAQYLHLKLGRLTNLIFRNEDKDLLTYLYEDGIQVEPEWYLPVIPMCLVNGCEGIATEWSTDIPMFDPRIIIENLLSLLRRENIWKTMRPHCVGFKGEVTDAEEAGSYKISGVVRQISDTEIEITEIPPSKTIEDYRNVLKSLENTGTLKCFQELYEGKDIRFNVQFMSAEDLKAIKKSGLLETLRLVSCISTKNMHLINAKNEVSKYHCADEILQQFFYLRLPYYQKRKETLLKEIEINKMILSNKIKFIEEVRNHGIHIFYEDLKGKFAGKGYHEIKGDAEFSHLLNIAVCELSKTNIKKLKRGMESLTQQEGELKESTPEKLWIKDLIELQEGLAVVLSIATDDLSQED